MWGAVRFFLRLDTGPGEFVILLIWGKCAREGSLCGADSDQISDVAHDFT